MINLAASVMMNGVCCIHSMQEEEKRQRDQRESLRKAINVEWQRQRLMELENREETLRQEGKDAATIMAAERRRLLMVSKMNASQKSSSSSSSSSTNGQERQRQREYCTLGTSLIEEEEEFPEIVMDRSRSAPVTAARTASNDGRRHRRPQPVPLLVGDASKPKRVYCTNVSSLLDDDEESDDEFDEVKLT